MPLISPASQSHQRRALKAHEILGTTDLRNSVFQLRDVVRESWLRSIGFQTESTSTEHTVLADGDLHQLRTDSPLRLVLPVFDRLLLEPARDTGLILAIGDHTGRLLWVKGESQVLRQAESMAFVPGADWSERTVGTSAPGTALATGTGVQVSGAEHFNEIAHTWSCSAVPIHAPSTGEVIGVVDLTGGEEAVAPYSLALLKAAVAAAESELRWQQERVEPPAAGRSVFAVPERRAGKDSDSLLRLMPATGPSVVRGTENLELSTRHAELLTLLSWHPRGLSGEELVDLLHVNPDAADLGTLRAELVRLRKLLSGFDDSLVPLSRPYRLAKVPRSDAREVLKAIESGALDAALEHYEGPVLERSSAPGIEAIRVEVFAALRQAMLQDGNEQQLLRFLQAPETIGDEELLSTTLQVLPARSPHRALIVASLERLEANE
ncbi:GAF domain-containing protein [Paeniglutamicibacter sp. NPDC091659]|uniref:GAF domain-containing protein n=1 Tax=Paeniglutamicibacter sp. NPDC091659 TaxID=3364389 RepID=UPI003821C100